MAEHYETLLAPVYVWMAGAMDAAITRGQSELEAFSPSPSTSARAVDLGAGFGMHAIPLARIGYSVLAIDSSETLIRQMQSHPDAAQVEIVNDDMRSFRKHLRSPAALIVCMGDTLTHLPDHESVERLCADVAQGLEGGGRFIVTFRDYSSPLAGLQRFIPVRSDPDRILTCFLEYDDDALTVHDLLYERDGLQWSQRVSAYRKLRLSPDSIIATLERNGLLVTSGPGPAGMIRLMAPRPL